MLGNQTNNNSNKQSLESQGQDILWYLKVFIVKKSTQSVRQFFDIYDSDHDNCLWVQEFQKMINTVHVNVDTNVIKYLFQLGDMQNTGKMSFTGFEQLMMVIDINKHIPYKIQQEMQSQQYYKQALQKLVLLLKQFQTGQKNPNDIFSLKNGQQLTYKEFFDYLDIQGCKLEDMEKIEITKRLDPQPVFKIEGEIFLKFLGVQYQKPQQNFNLINQQQQQRQKISENIPVNNVQSNINFPKHNIPNNNQTHFSQKNIQQQQKQKIDANYESIIAQNKLKNQNFSMTIIKNNDQFVNLFNSVQGQQEKNSNFKFQDSKFLANEMSLQLEGKENRKYRWLRPDQFFHGRVNFFQKMDGEIIQSRIGLSGGLGQYITPYDVIQGELGDCYFLSSISSLAVEPERILKLFRNPTVNEFGLYGITLCHDGEWETFWVDDQIPCREHINEPAFTKGNGNEIWVLLLEKAWAKLWGSYGRVESGLCRDALRDLTGAPTQVIRCEKEDKLTKQVHQNQDILPILEQSLGNHNNSFIITAGSYSESSGLTQSLQDTMGLVAGHAYSIIKLIHLQHPINRQQITLLKMRNPWAEKEWRGDWSDNSDLWTPQLKEKHKIKNRDDGIFYMDITDFYKYFNDIEICYYHKFYKYNSLRINTKKHNSGYVTLQVEESGQYYITVNQKSKRHFPSSSKYKYSPTRLILIKLDPQDQKIIAAKQIEDREAYVEGYLEKGVTYLLMAKVDWRFNDQFESVVSSYGVGHTLLKVQSDVKPFKNVLQESMLKRIQKDFQNILKPYEKHQTIFKGHKFLIDEGIGFVYIRNDSTDKLIETTLTFSNIQGLKQRKPNRGNKCEVILPPSEEFLSVFTIGNEGYTFSMSESYIVRNI